MSEIFIIVLAYGKKYIEGGIFMRKSLLEKGVFSFESFSHEDALNIGIKAQQIVKKEHLKAVGIRITYKNLLIFQYLMDGKKEDHWLKRKEKTVLDSGHSSYYVYCHQNDYQSWLNDESYAICGGGYPIIENGQCVGSICISGLKHDDDHQLIIKILKELEDIK